MTQAHLRYFCKAFHVLRRPKKQSKVVAYQLLVFYPNAHPINKIMPLCVFYFQTLCVLIAQHRRHPKEKTGSSSSFKNRQ